MKKIKIFLAPFILVLSIMLSACGGDDYGSQAEDTAKTPAVEKDSRADLESEADEAGDTAGHRSEIAIQESTISLSEIPAYTGGSAYVAINGNVPDFKDSDMITESFEMYSDLDGLGRCGVAYANIGTDLMPTEKRGDIGQIKPTGWHTVKYDNIDGNYLYNRCHLIGYQLTAENANEKNLITGTRYLNVNGMLPFENMVADYIKETNNHVLYRVTPVFEGDNLVATGVQMEAKSVEDHGEGILYNVFCYNVQPDISIVYATGESSQGVLEADNSSSVIQIPDYIANESVTESIAETSVPEQQAAVSEKTYVLNTNTKKFHVPTCRDIGKMKDLNKQEYVGTRDAVVNQGYDPCKHCNP